MTLFTFYFNKDEKASIKKTEALQARVKGNKPPLSVDAYTGDYENGIYGTVTISKEEGNDLTIKFNGHNRLTAKLQYMDNEQWLLTYNNLSYGIFPVKFVTANKEVKSITLRVNEFIDFDEYKFDKK